MTEEEKENIIKELKKESILLSIKIIICTCILIVLSLYVCKEFKSMSISNQWKNIKTNCINFVEDCKNSVETYTVSCKVSDKYVSSRLVLDVPMGALTNHLHYEEETDYVIVLEHKENLYEIFVDKNVYDKISIGEERMCKVTARKDIFTQECSYQFALLEE